MAALTHTQRGFAPAVLTSARPSRRNVLTTASLTSLAAVTLAGFPKGRPDAALLAACNRHLQAFQATEVLIHVHGEKFGPHLPDGALEEQGQQIERLRDCVDDVRDIPARTAAGLRAKARVLLIDEGSLPGREPDTLLTSLLRDLLAEHVA